MTRECVNRGGRGSLVRLDEVPRLEVPCRLERPALEALECWEPRLGEIYTVAAPENRYYRARLIDYSPESATFVPFETFSRPPESPVALEIYQALPEKERFELILEKLTEVGVSRIVPFVSRRSATLEERDAGQKKSHRWPHVLLRAARQCRRAMIPELFPVVSWDEATHRASGADLKLLLFEGEAPWSLREGLREARPARVALLIGPEGGFEGEEVEEARGMGFLPVSLGPRILRTETASIVAAAIAQYALGDLG